MLLHFVEMGIDDYMKLFGLAEIIFALLFLLPATSKIGLLFLTAYFGGAIAMELPYGMAAAPAVPLALIWLTAFIHRPSLMMYDMKSPARKDVLASGMGS